MSGNYIVRIATAAPSMGVLRLLDILPRSYMEGDEKKPIPEEQKKKYATIGWREWVSLPEIGIRRIKAKIDTGARTSALHAFALRTFMENNKLRIQFDIHPLQHTTSEIITCVADVIDKRLVTDSGGHMEERFVICTPITIGDQTWPIEITLTERENMLFRMLLGRRALRKRYLINPTRSFVSSKVRQP